LREEAYESVEKTKKALKIIEKMIDAVIKRKSG
jgi:hypothetical protein